jgi:hypothetical protein
MQLNTQLKLKNEMPILVQILKLLKNLKKRLLLVVVLVTNEKVGNNFLKGEVR